MGTRVEWAKASNVSPLLYERGMLADDGQQVTERYGLALGAQVFEGTEAELEDMLQYALQIVRGE